MEIVLVRHGETAWNREEIFRGRQDVPLNETGLKQSELLSRYLSGKRVTAVFSNPLIRAVKTAEVIALPHRVSVQIAPEITDLDYGKWVGLSQGEVRTNFGTLYAAWLESPHLVRMPEGESLQEVRERALSFVSRVSRRYEGTVIAVSHRVTLKVLICGLLGLDDSHFWSLRIDNGAVTTFSCEDERYILVSHNETSFLGALGESRLRDF